MPKLRLTSTAVDRFQPPPAGQIEYYDTHLPAFGLRLSYSGAKAWFVMTRVNGKLTRITLGRHPAISLAEARAKARLAVEHARNGGDPRRIAAGAPTKGEGASNHIRVRRRPVHDQLRGTRTPGEYG